MALPISLTSGWASIIAANSPNGIAAENSNIAIFGTISSVIPTVRAELEAGQSVMFKTNESQIKVIYSNDTYYLVEEKDIVFIESEVTPP